MNNNLEFRVWDKRNKQFLQELSPYHWHNPNGETDEPEGEANLFDLSFFIYNEKNYTVTQFTGIVDKNGNKIYNGDILRYVPDYFESKGGQIGPTIDDVNYHFACFYFGNTQLNDYIDNELSAAQEFPFIDLEIIGNIFENKDLLK